MFDGLLSLTSDQRRLVAWGQLLEHLLDQPSKDLINRMGIEQMVKYIGSRHSIQPSIIQAK